jgi:hypothetical protein
MLFICLLPKNIWLIKLLHSTLRKFFVIHLSRKAEGNGPTTPWQPEMFMALKGANSIPVADWDR